MCVDGFEDGFVWRRKEGKTRSIKMGSLFIDIYIEGFLSNYVKLDGV